MKKYLTIFDTNAYRNLTYGFTISDVQTIIKDIKRLENSNGYKAYSSPFVPVELGYHLCDHSDPGYEPCKVSLVANYLHTCQSGDRFRILAEKESLINAFLFDIKEQPHKLLIENIFKIAVDLINNNDFDASLSPICSILLESVEKAETEFLENVKTALKAIDAKYDGLYLFRNDKRGRKTALKKIKNLEYALPIASALVKQAHHSLNRTLIVEDLIPMSKEISRIFRAAISLYHELLYRLVMSGSFNLNSSRTNWGNWFWDIEHLFSINDSLIDGRIPIMVTGDIPMSNKLKEIYQNVRVYTLIEYKNEIGIST